MPRHPRPRRITWGAALILAACGFYRPAAAQREAETLSASFRKAADRVAPSVVGIRPLDAVDSSSLGGPIGPGGFIPGMPPRSLHAGRGPSGSGIAVDPARGLILTCEFVVRGASRVAVILPDGRELAADRVVRDPRSGLVLLSVDPKAANLPTVDWAEDAAREGDWVVSVGRSGGAVRTLSAGIVSALGPSERGETVLLTDAFIAADSVGGPLVNLDGKVVGIAVIRAELARGARDFGHAVPGGAARKVASDLADLGRVRRGYLGLRIEREEASRTQPSGRLYVAGVLQGSPAAEAGLQIGDRIESLDGRPVAEVESVSRAVTDAPVGHEFAISIVRGGTTKEIRVKSREYPAEAAMTPAEPRSNRMRAPLRVLPRDRPRAVRPRQAAPKPSDALPSEPSDVPAARPSAPAERKPEASPGARPSPRRPSAEVESEPAPDLPPALDPAPDPPPANEPAPKAI